jgi:quinohemoprotein ethanol dehydrogenase
MAWDPVRQREAWRVDLGAPWNGGTLTTAGNLVFQGTADGRFVAYDARDGRLLWQAPLGTGIVAAPSTFELDGEQYVSIAVGWGGVYGIVQRHTDSIATGRVYTFRLGGSAALPAAAAAPARARATGIAYRAEDVGPGAGLYVANCAFCHGVPGVNNGGNVPNLAYTTPETLRNLPQMVLEGAWSAHGMPRFAGRLTEAEVLQIRAFVLGTTEATR